MRHIRLDFSQYLNPGGYNNNKTMEKVEISKVTLKVGGKDIELTLEQARELKDVLGELFPEKANPLGPIQPILIEPCWPRPWEQWQTWCSGTGTLAINCKS